MGKYPADEDRQIWTKSGWLTRQESVSTTINGITYSRSFSIGLSTDTKDRLPAREHYECLNTALNIFIEKERDAWLNEVSMKKDAEEFRAKLQELTNEQTAGQ